MDRCQITYKSSFVLTKTTIQLILKEPFYGHFLTGLVKAFSEKVDTLAVSVSLGEGLKLWVNPNYWKSLKDQPELQYGLLKHEVLHIVFKHLLSIRQYENKRIFNIAADLVVNQYISQKRLPPGAITLALFPDLNLKMGASVAYYYSRLLQAWRTSQTKLEESLPDSFKTLRDLVLEGHPHLDKHQGWEKEASRFSQPEMRVMEGMLKEAVCTALKRVGGQEVGRLPASLQAYLQEFQEPASPQVNWRRLLRIFAHGSSQTYLKNTIRKPSKRYGTIPGIKIKQRTKVLVAVDTSGSIANDDLDRFFSEIYHIWSQGTEIQIAECDVSIKRQYSYKGQKPQVVSGRGGTDFNAPIAYANQSYHPDAIIYFTDGFGPIPHITSRYPILWMITSKGISQKTDTWQRLPGRKVRMNNE